MRAKKGPESREYTSLGGQLSDPDVAEIRHQASLFDVTEVVWSLPGDGPLVRAQQPGPRCMDGVRGHPLKIRKVKETVSRKVC